MSDARIEALLAGFTAEERIKLRPPGYAAEFLGLSSASVYRYVAEGRLSCIKLDGSDRGARGRSGAIRFRLADLIRFSVEREVGAVLPAAVPASTRRVNAQLEGIAGGRR